MLTFRFGDVNPYSSVSSVVYETDDDVTETSSSSPSCSSEFMLTDGCDSELRPKTGVRGVWGLERVEADSAVEQDAVGDGGPVWCAVYLDCGVEETNGKARSSCPGSTNGM